MVVEMMMLFVVELERKCFEAVGEMQNATINTARDDQSTKTPYIAE
jgi:hypothetical protein